ncbi:PEP-CTERM sorting domain-containing protein [Planctomycetales bacterium ZRK34]|nr:PEP-CTERM sorting domain-containing protein [Planctomycetales bacterium ZRK34]
MKFQHTLLMAAAVALIGGSVVQAALIVDFGGTEYVSANQVMQAGGFDINGDPLALYPTTDYNTAATSAVFHGQQEASAGNQNLVGQDGGGDRLIYKCDNAASLTALTLWTSDNFLGAAAGGPVDLLSASDTVSFNVVTYAQINTVRLVVRIADDYYISSQAFTAGTGTMDVDPTALSWFTYDPAAALVYSSGSAASIVSGGVISGVTEVGFYVARTDADGTSGNALRLNSFEVDATPSSVVIPEPATLAMFCLGAIGLGTRRKKL